MLEAHAGILRSLRRGEHGEHGRVQHFDDALGADFALFDEVVQRDVGSEGFCHAGAQQQHGESCAKGQRVGAEPVKACPQQGDKGGRGVEHQHAGAGGAADGAVPADEHGEVVVERALVAPEAGFAAVEGAHHGHCLHKFHHGGVHLFARGVVGGGGFAGIAHGEAEYHHACRQHSGGNHREPPVHKQQHGKADERRGIGAGVQRGAVGNKGVQAAHVVLHHFGERGGAMVVQIAERNAGKAVGQLAAQDGFQAEGGQMRNAEGIAAQEKGGKGQRGEQGGGEPVGTVVKQALEYMRHQQQRGSAEHNGGGGEQHCAADLRADGLDNAPRRRGLGLGHGRLPITADNQMIAGLIWLGNGRTGKRWDGCLPVGLGFASLAVYAD